MKFRDRADAARQLAAALAPLAGARPLVLAIPRGGAPMGRIVADALGGELDLILVRKIGAPGNPELAVGAVDEGGAPWVSPDAAALGATPDYLAAEAFRQIKEIARRRAAWPTRGHAPDPAGRTVIVIDDGLATGATMITALDAVRRRGPARLICAVPVAAADSLETVRRHADEVVCLHAPAAFWAVSQFYEAFPQVEDGEVAAALVG